MASQILGPGRRAALTSYCLGPGPLPRHALACERAALASYGLGPGPPPDATLNLGAWPWHLMGLGRDLSPDTPLIYVCMICSYIVSFVVKSPSGGKNP